MAHEHDHGFHHDLPRILGRRSVLIGLSGMAGMAATGAIAQDAVCLPTAPETAGPFPANGRSWRVWQKALNLLDKEGVIREDIRPSIAGLTPTAEGTPFRMEIQLGNANKGCAPLAGLAFYAWQCDAAGRYSMYQDKDRNYLRGIGISDADGKVRFTTVYPGCYRGRWPHIHFEVFASAQAAVSGQRSLLTSQLALPENASRATYAANADYAASIPNIAGLSFNGDPIWRDNSAAEKDRIMMRLTGDASTGFVGTSVVGLDV